MKLQKNQAKNRSNLRLGETTHRDSNTSYEESAIASSGVPGKRNIPKTARNERKKSWFTTSKKKGGKSPEAPKESGAHSKEEQNLM